LASEAQSRLLAADALVRKYGHERLLGSLLRLEGREEVEAKFDSTIRELQSITNKVRCADTCSTAGGRQRAVAVGLCVGLCVRLEGREKVETELDSTIWSCSRSQTRYGVRTPAVQLVISNGRLQCMCVDTAGGWRCMVLEDSGGGQV
jgi:hypothetical protein